MHDLTPSTMAVFRIQGNFPVELVFHLTTLAFPAPFDRAEFLGGLHLIRRTVFPGFLVNGMFGEEVSEGWFGDWRGREGDIFRHVVVAVVVVVGVIVELRVVLVRVER